MCDAAQMITMNQYITDFETIMGGKDTYRKTGNGAFIHSCFTHCEALGPQWNTIAVNGMTIQQAFLKWWNSDAESASSHTHTSACMYHTASWPHQCNPTCGGGAQPIVVV